MIDFTITACDEYDELKSLIYYLKYFLRDNDKILVMLDETNTNENMIKLVQESSCELHICTEIDINIKSNFIKSKCKNDIIFGLCADEVPTIPLVQQSMKIFDENPQLDAVAIPRINIFSDLTQENANTMYVGNRGSGYLLKEPINEYGWHSWPDYQIRLYKNVDYIGYYGQNTHSGLVGYKNLGILPADPSLAFIHIKSIERQERILKLYDKIGKG